MIHNTSIIRPEMRFEDIQHRGQGNPPESLKLLRKGLRTFHALETMAVNIYRFQSSQKRDELNRQLIAAMCNEMVHLQDFQVKLCEYRFKPSGRRWAHGVAGSFLGLISRLLGQEAILKTGIWLEKKAVRHYAKLLNDIPWDEETRKIIEKDKADEEGHIARWTHWLEHLKEADN
ncbi:MAG: demethoxyubiquinone hydroxylase family protein [Candidatus Aminicenantales bacterium]